MNTLIPHYFPGLNRTQQTQFGALESLYRYWNAQINVISRKDIDNLYLHHVLHGLAIARFVRFTANTIILDAGTGGGFPGIPLAILFPKATFYLADSITKKIRVVTEISRELNLENVIAINQRFEQCNLKPDFITGRAVIAIDRFYAFAKGMIAPKNKNSIANGILYLGGGKINPTFIEKNHAVITPLSNYYKEPYFDTKSLIYIPRRP